MPSPERFEILRALTVALCLLLPIAGCGVEGEAGGLGADKLSREECEQLMAKIAEVMAQGLPGEERETFLADSGDDPDAVDSCARGETWDRGGYECAMKATSEGGLKRCILM